MAGWTPRDATLRAWRTRRTAGRCTADQCGHKHGDHDTDGRCLATIPLITGPRPCFCTGYVACVAEQED